MRLLLLILCLSVPCAASAAQPTVTGTATVTAPATSITDISLNVTANERYAVIVLANSSAVRTFTVSCTGDGAMSEQTSFNYGVGRSVVLFTRLAASAGGSPVTCTATQSSTFVAYDLVMFKWSACAGVCTLVNGSDGFMNSATMSHHMAPSGELDLAADTLWVGGCVANASFSTRTVTTNFETDTTNLSGLGFWQYEDDVPGGFTDTRGTWGSASARDSYCRAWGIRDVAASAGSGGLLLRGVGE